MSLQKCLPGSYLSKSSLLALLPTQVDTTKIIVIATGQILDVSKIPLSTINTNINDGIWTYYENLLPRRMLLTNTEWQITSFTPSTKTVCVQIFAKSGRRVLSFIL